MTTTARLHSLAHATAAAALAVALSGCIAAVGNRPSPDRSQTLGQELIDLQRARDAGAMSDGEFQSARQRLLGSGQ
jgi:hypothetical protein